MNKQRGFIAHELIIVVVLLFGLALGVGWCINIYKITQLCCDISGWLVLRGIGIFVAPLGGVLGFL